MRIIGGNTSEKDVIYTYEELPPMLLENPGVAVLLRNKIPEVSVDSYCHWVVTLCKHREMLCIPKSYIEIGAKIHDGIAILKIISEAGYYVKIVTESCEHVINSEVCEEYLITLKSDTANLTGIF